MGRGDGRSRRGKIFRGSYGKTRLRKEGPVNPGAPKPAPGKSAAKKSPPARKRGS